MAVMANMREYTKTVLVILVLAFVGTIIFDWGMDLTGLKQKKGVVAEINGQEISIDQFWRAYQQELENYRAQYGVEPTESTMEFLRNKVWDALIRDVLVQQEISKRNIQAYDQEILHYIMNDPPEILKRDSSFIGEDGQFDRAKYEAALRNPQADWKPVEDYLRAILPFQKFQAQFATTVFVTESEVRQEYLRRNQRATVEYLFFDPEKFNDVELEISEDELEKHYNDNIDAYKEPEKRKIEYVIFSKQATKKDSAEVENLAKEILQRAKTGEDFADLAQLYSSDNTADKGGDLGYFKRGRMVKPFEEAAFNAKVGEIIGPVRTRFGLHIIKVTGRKEDKTGEPEVRASHILLKFEASPSTIEAARDSANYIAAISKEDGWEKTLEAENVAAQTSAFFPQGSGFIPGLGVEREVSRFIFNNDVGDISDALETEQGFVVVRIADRQKARTKSFEEVRTLIESELRRKKRKELAGELARKARREIDQGTSFTAIAARDSLVHQMPEPFTRNNYIPDVGRDPAFIGAAFALEKDQVSNPVEGLKGYYIIKLLDKTEFDEEDYKLKADLIRQDLEQKKQQSAFTLWFTSLKEKSKIKDFRNQYF